MRMKQLYNSLLKWYEAQGRHNLLWRNTDNIYHIYLSEIMLQQTQASRVQEHYYPKFLQNFPTLKDLADASLEEVLAAWSGLGYYRRAQNLHKCAKEVVCGLPKTQKDLEKLPGIGKYTASAICSFGYDQKVPVVDTNIARVLKRLFALENPADKTVWEKAAEFLNEKSPKEHNLGLMDLGSLICLPKAPKCFECPLKSHCLGQSEPELYTKTKRTQYEALDLFLGVCIENNKIALTPTSGNMYKDMLELPSTDPVEENYIGKFKHSYTKYRLTVRLYKLENYDGKTEWAELESIHRLPLSSLTKKAIERVFKIQ